MKKALFSKIVILLALGLFLFQTNAIAAQANLAWDPPEISTDVTGYMIHYGTASGTYTQGVDVGNTTSYTVSNLIAGQTYYFAVTAYNAAKYQSTYSNEISNTISPSEYVLMVLSPEPELGKVSGTDIDCGDACLAAFSAGTVVTLSATPEPDSTFEGWTGGGCSGTGSCTATMNANTTISAKFKKKTIVPAVYYSIYASVSGTGGAISPSGTTSVSAGLGIMYSVTPAPSYSVASVMVDGINIGAVNRFTFSNVAANHTISATFTKNRDNISGAKNNRK